MHRLSRFARFISFIVAGSITAALAEPAPEGSTGIASARPPAIGAHSMVVSANPLATKAGRDVLDAGGTAADAAIAVQAVLALVEPQSSGLGGGAYVVYWDAKQQHLTSFDARETAPSSATPELFLNPDGTPMSFGAAVIGGRSVGTPGTPKLLETLHRRFGKLPWHDLFDRALSLAETGFPVPHRLAGALATDATVSLDPAARQIYFDADGHPPIEGSILTNKPFAESLRELADHGPAAFYTGRIAADIVATVTRPPNQGTLSLSDLASYRVIEREPLCGRYRIYRVCGMGPSSAGGTAVIQMLSMLERFPSREVTGLSPGAVHLFAEANRLAFADREAYLADPAFVHQPFAALIAPAYLRERSRLIDPDKSLVDVRPGVIKGFSSAAAGKTPEPPSTSEISIVDRYGNALAMTTTVESAFGSRRMVDGFVLNNELTDFSFVPEQNGKPVANRVEPGKRPRSSMSPMILFTHDGKVAFVVGSAGGSLIIPNVAQTLVGLIDGELDPQQAVALPHIAARSGNVVELEIGTPAEGLAPALRSFGYQVKSIDMTSGIQAIAIRNGRLFGGSDPRRDGIGLGD